MSTTPWDPDPQARYRDPMQGGSGMKQRWMPPADVTDHFGNPIPPNWDFFVSPPPTIGKLVSAASNLETNDEPMSPNSRLMVAIVAAIIGGGIGLAIGWALDALPMLAQAGIGVALAALAFWLAYVLTSFDHVCTFVGTEGIASITCSGSRSDILPPEIFRYEQATEVRSSTTHHYGKYGQYQSTAYEVTWYNGAGEIVYSVTGSHGYEDAIPPPSDLYCFAKAGEFAFTQFIYDRVVQQMKMSGFYQFNLSGGDYVRLGQGFIEFNLGGTPQLLRTPDIAFANLDNGILTIKRHGATEGWFSSDGVFTFPYGNIANPRLFLMLFNQYVFRMP